MKDLVAMEQQTLFDYASLDSDTRAYMQELDAELDVVLKRSSEEIGHILLKAKTRLPHGMFQPWHFSKGISQNMAWRCMQVAQGKELKSSILDDLPAIREARQEVQAINLASAPNPGVVFEESTEMHRPVEPIILDIDGEKLAHILMPTIVRNVDNIPIAVPHISSKNNEWYTPAKYIEAARKLMGGIDLDPASCAFANETVHAANYYDITQNGLDKEWHGRVWLNPPYGYTDGESNQALWSSRLIKQYNKGNGSTTEAVLLVNAAVDTNWFHDLLAEFPVCLTRGRINFATPEPVANGSTHGSAFVYFGPQPGKFVELFSEFGTVVRQW